MKKIELIKEFESRLYQQSIFANSVNKNTLVVLPTGLGKTIIAIMSCVFYFNKTGKKVLFLAPTKPLVEQQEKSFKSFFVNSNEFSFQVLTGLVSPKKRADLYSKADFVFSTPQLVENDIINGIINTCDFCLIVIDEAHRGTGNYAYTFIAEEFDKANAKILALTASPGTSKEEILQIKSNLKIEHIEVRKSDDSDVAPYVNKTEITQVKVDLSEDLKKIKESFNRVYAKRILEIKNLGYLQGKNPKTITKTDLLELQNYLRALASQKTSDENVWRGISISAGLMKLSYGIELFESQDFEVCYNYFYNFFRDGKNESKAVLELTLDIEFREAFEELSILVKSGVIHPKFTKLEELVFAEFSKNADLRIIIFSQYRETASRIVKELSKVKEIRPVLFVGQAKKTEKGLSQKEQKDVLEKFKLGDYNILVSTSVGEEGLDIAKVDVVIFYEPVPSAIRSIQRIGRTGRFKKGKAYVLMTNGTRDIVTNVIANAKEKRMYSVLSAMQKEMGERGREMGEKNLSGFLKQNTQIQKKEEENSQLPTPNSQLSIVVDNRENNDLLKELFRIKELKVETKKLEIADIVISDYIAIERKSKVDFVNSIIDKRLFEQLLNLAQNYRRPLLIIEGEENIFSIRNLNPNVIRSTLSAIAVDMRIPIIFTDNLSETAQMVLTIAKRSIKDKKEISLADNKTAHSENEELEKFVSSIPKINVISAKSLLKSFKSVNELVNADEKTLQEVEGIGKLRAKFLVEFFKREYL